MKKILLFSGTSNISLTKKIAKKLDAKLGDIDITRFIDNECRVWVKEDVSQYDHIFVLQSLSQIADQNLVELCLIGQALKSLKVKHVTVIVPWFGYSKQDKEFRKGEAVSSQLVAKFIQIAGFDQMITLELHSENLVPYFKIPVIELSTHELLSQSVGDFKNKIIVSPDKGGKSRSERFAKSLELPIIYIEKKRDLTTGEVKIISVSGDVKNREVVIFDDIINTGATAIKVSEFLEKKGAKKITFLATHAVLAGDAVEKLNMSPIHEIIVTDTIFIPKKKQINKLKIVTVSNLISERIKKMVK